jgi:hypothetical protein
MEDRSEFEVLLNTIESNYPQMMFYRNFKDMK